MRSAKVIETEAAAWLARLDARQARERPPEFEAWLDNDPRHRAAFTRLEVAWKRSDLLRKLKPPDRAVNEDLLAPRASAQDGLWTHASAFGVAQGAGAHDRASKRTQWRSVLPAVIVGLALVVVSVSWLVLGDLHSRVYETSIGGRAHVVLPDASVAELNSNTRIRVKFDRTRRQVEILRGEALFTVEHQADRPFEVTAAGVVARAVGTQFSVRVREDDRAETLVRQGYVAILQPRRLLGVALGRREVRPVLGAGDRAIADEISTSIENVDSADLDRRLLWAVGKVEFRGETVREVVRELNRYSLHPIRVIDPEVAEKHFGGTFRTNDAASFVDGLSALYGTSAFAVVD
jgi:transmembrane sensor